jgi:hypothetical protein
MAKLIVIEFLTLDGVMEAPENWQFSFVNPEIMEVNQSQIHSLDALLLGRLPSIGRRQGCASSA